MNISKRKKSINCNFFPFIDGYRIDTVRCAPGQQIREGGRSSSRPREWNMNCTSHLWNKFLRMSALLAAGYQGQGDPVIKSHVVELR